jgi:pimeloyl-ACP methyl ester carboxylesterase
VEPGRGGAWSAIVGETLLGGLTDPATRDWARDQLRRTSLSTGLSAIHATLGFDSQKWIGHATVPAAVVVTTRDQVVPAHRQHTLAAAIPAAVVCEVEADHGVCVSNPEMFLRVLVDACQRVAAAGRHHLTPRQPFGLAAASGSA